MQNLQLTIPEPCHENWQQMTPTDQGRFCNACAKEVIDFSAMTDIQVLNYFTKMTHEKVCGRALPEQLDRAINRPAQPKKRLFWYWNYMVMFFMFFGKGNSAKAQGTMSITTEQLNLIKSTNINNALAGRVGGVKISNNKIVSGKVSDKDGNPVSFASIKIKGTATGIAADSNGVYSIKANPNAILCISGAAFKSAEIPIGSQSAIHTVLEKVPASEIKEIVINGMLGGISFRNMDDYTYKQQTKSVAIITVVDEETGRYLQNAALEIVTDKNIDSVFTDKKGIYKLKGIKKYEKYFIKVKADGYEPNEFTIEANDFKDRKKEWEVLLRKQKVEVVRSTSTVKLGSETRIRLGGIMTINKSDEPIYVLDGIIIKNISEINTNDIEDITILKGTEAAALFGSAGANGAVIITSKLKVKNLEPVVVTAYGGRTVGRLVCTSTTSVMGSMVKGVTIKSTVADTLKMIATKINGAIKLYPNPVQRGEQLNIALKLKQAGLYQVHIIDAAGRIVLAKQINAHSKDYAEKILADSRWGSGVYYISIHDEKNNLISKSSFIVQ